MRIASFAALSVVFVLCAPTPSFAGNAAGNTFEFDGVADYFEAIGPGGEWAPLEYTIEAWVFPTSVSGRRTVYATNDPAADGLGIYIENGDFVLEARGEITTVPAGYVTNEWQHLAITRSGAFMRIYRNGSLVSIRTTAAAQANANVSGRIGRNTVGNFFAGRIDQLRVWSESRSNFEIQDTMFRPVSPFAAFLEVDLSFDEGVGTSITDAAVSGGNDVANLSGVANWLASTAPLATLSVHAQNTFAIWSQVPSSGSKLVPFGLSITDVDFLNQEGDDLAYGDNGTLFGLNPSNLPAAVGAHWDVLYQLSVSDVGGDGGTVTLTFDESEAGGPGALDPGKIYSLLRRNAGSSAQFEVLDAGTPSGGDEISFTVDVADIGTGSEFTLGVMTEASLGLYFDAGYTQTEIEDQPLFTPFDAWVVAKGIVADPSEGMATWEGLVDFPPEISVISATLVPPTATNAGDPGGEEWIVDLQSCVAPDGTGDLLLVQYSLQLVDRPTAVTTIPLGATDPSTFSPAAAGWSDCAGNLATFTSFVEPTLRFPSPNIESVADVPDDQGGWVRITVDRSTLDDATETSTPITGYNLWREVTGSKRLEGRGLTAGDELEVVGLATLVRWGARVVEDRVVVTGDPTKGPNTVPPGTWEVVTSFFAIQQSQYQAASPTTADGVATSFFVTAHTASPSVWYGSGAGSGASVDNIAPGVPQNIAAGYAASGVDLSWDPAPEEDFQFYRVYRDGDPAFVPGPGTLVQEIAVPTWFDGTGVPWGFFYKITAIDHAGNEGQPGSPLTVTGNESSAPTRYALGDAVPNPFNPRTRISFSLPDQGPVRLRVFDVSGRLITTLVNEVRPAGRHDVEWNGTDQQGASVASGVYLFRVEASGFSSTKRATLLK